MIKEVRDYNDGPVYEVKTFSSPPVHREPEWWQDENGNWHDEDRGFRVIKRPPVPELDGFIERYL
ncbi:hypothetical protein IKE88_02880 [Candidatus Saccharibacteria bacterium]|nr:hypothetical protein [Candidatus Saccharibacteria bacterium]